MILLTLDFETAYGKHPETGENITLSKMTTEEYVRHPDFKIHGVGLKVDDRGAKYFYDPQQLTHTLETLPWKKIALLGQNTLFDGFILSHHFNIIPKFYLDTKSMSRALWPQDPASLASIAKRLGIGQKGKELENTKDKWELTDEEQERLGYYCATGKNSDCNLTYWAFQMMKKHVPVEELRNIDTTIRMYCDPILELDKGVLEDHLDDLQDKKRKLLQSVGADSEEGLKSLRSNKQFAQLLIDYGVDPPMKISPTTNKETYAFAKTDEGMQALLEHPNEDVQALVGARLGVKSSIEETRTIRFLGIADRGKLPVAIQAFGAPNTLRWAALEKQNLQNLPRGGALRQSIIPPPGHKLVVADLSQIEARMLAWVAGQGDLIEAFEQGIDPYCNLASEIFGRPITKGKDTLERNVGKALVLGCGYGMGKVKFGSYLASGPLGMPPILLGADFADEAGIGWRDFDPDEAKEYTTKLRGDDLLAHASSCSYLIGMYRSLNKQITKYWKTCDRIIRAMYAGQKEDFGVIRTSQDRLWLPTGLSLHYKNLREDEETGNWVYDGLKGRGRDTQYIYGAKLTENIVQALSRCVLTHMMNEITQYYRVVLTVHDEIISCVPTQQAEACLETCLDIMRIPPRWCESLPLDAEGGIAQNYAEAK